MRALASLQHVVHIFCNIVTNHLISGNQIRLSGKYPIHNVPIEISIYEDVLRNTLHF